MMHTCAKCAGAFWGSEGDTLCANCDPTPEELLRRYRRALERIAAGHGVGCHMADGGRCYVEFAAAVLAGEDPDRLAGGAGREV